MYKIGEFIYPWGGGHYSRMMRFDRALMQQMGSHTNDMEIHYSSKGRIYQRLLEKFAQNTDRVHEILMPTPIDGSMGPSVSKSLANLLFAVEKNPPLISQIASYLRQERGLYDAQKFDLVVNDGDMGSNILAKNRDIPCLFVTNQFKPRLYKSRSYLYPAVVLISKQIAKASKILVADSPPPHTICEYNLNFSKKEIEQEKVTYVGHFTADDANKAVTEQESDLKKLLLESNGRDFGYWMRTGDKSTNDGTGKRYEKVFARDEIKNKERRLVSHARDDPGIDSVTDVNGNRYTIREAVDKKIDWIQIDIGFLSEHDKDAVLEMCSYAVINGSHTVMGEIMGGKEKPIIGIPIYDEHTNNIRWAHEHGLGVLANSTRQVVRAISDIKRNKSKYADGLKEFAKNFDGRGAQNAAKIASEMLP